MFIMEMQSSFLSCSPSYNLNSEQKKLFLKWVVIFFLSWLFSGDKLVRATELVKLLSLDKSMQGAIKLVTKLKLPNLAERFNSILEVTDPQHSNKFNRFLTCSTS